MVAAELRQLSHETGLLTTLHLDEGHEIGMGRMTFSSSHEMRQAYPKGSLKAAGEGLVVKEIQYGLQGVPLVLVHRLASRAPVPLPPAAQIGQQRVTCEMSLDMYSDPSPQRSVLQLG
jgi:hypothetical protein